jgi:hypothetical protein
VKINDVQIGAITAAAAAGVDRAAAQPTATADAAAPGASIASLASATSVAAGMNLAAAERSARLDQLTQQVRSGVYRPTASELADQLVAEARFDARLVKTLG